MQTATLLKTLLGLKEVVVEGMVAEDGAMVVKVRPRWRLPGDPRTRRPASY